MRIMKDDRRILLLDTSGKIGTVGIATEQGVVAAAALPGQTHHAAELMPTLQQLLAGPGWSADSLTDVFLPVGPGSFTGLRLSVSVARTMAWSVGARLVALGTMSVLARNGLSITSPPEHVAVLLDAKRGQTFDAAFTLQDGSYRAVIEPCLEEPAVFLARCPQPLTVLGEGIPLHEAALAQTGCPQLPAEYWPSRPEHIHVLGMDQARQGLYIAAGDLVPHYVRRPEMEERWEKKQAALGKPIQ